MTIQYTALRNTSLLPQPLDHGSRPELIRLTSLKFGKSKLKASNKP